MDVELLVMVTVLTLWAWVPTATVQEPDEGVHDQVPEPPRLLLHVPLTGVLLAGTDVTVTSTVQVKLLPLPGVRTRGAAEVVVTGTAVVVVVGRVVVVVGAAVVEVVEIGAVVVVVVGGRVTVVEGAAVVVVVVDPVPSVTGVESRSWRSS